MRYAVGVDIGGTTIKAGLVDKKGNILRKVIVRTGKTKQRVLKDLFLAIKAVSIKDVCGIGIGCPGPFKDFKKGIIGKTPNIPLQDVKLKDIIQKRFNKLVRVDNDASCYVLGETVFGATKNNIVVVGLTLGTGVGGGIIIRDKIFHGGYGNAGELGYLFMDKAFEYYLSEKGIMRLCRKFKVRDSIELYEKADKGNKRAIAIWREYGRILGVLVANIIHPFDPCAVVIGGGISKSWKHFNKSMHKEVKKKVLFGPKRVLRAKSQDSGIKGAAWLVLNA